MPILGSTHWRSHDWKKIKEKNVSLQGFFTKYNFSLCFFVLT